jgi:hypothetical protein
MAKYLEEPTLTSRNTSPAGGEKISTNRARQGLLGKPVLMVLIGGLLLAVVAWTAAEKWGESIDPQSGTTTQTAPAPVPPAAPSANP